MEVQHDIRDSDSRELVNEIFSNPPITAKWSSFLGITEICQLLLGAPVGSYPDPWPDDTYNIILDFRYDPNSGGPPTVTRVIEPF